MAEFYCLWLQSLSGGNLLYVRQTGAQVVGDNISIYDNALDNDGMAFPFDLEGMPKKRVDFIQNGIAKEMVYDTISGNKDGKPSTGHAVSPAESGQGAFPFNIFISPGQLSLDDMIGKVEKGILVTRFHYINGYLDTRNALMTGMTRDGTFLIKNGKLSKGIKNLRFTDSVVDMFSNVVEMSQKLSSIPGWWDALGCNRVPAMRIAKLNFSGKTDF